MEILMLLIPMSVVLAALIAGVFWWSVRSGQFDDLEGPAHRILADDDRPADFVEAGARRRIAVPRIQLGDPQDGRRIPGQCDCSRPGEFHRALGRLAAAASPVQPAQELLPLLLQHVAPAGAARAQDQRQQRE